MELLKKNNKKNKCNIYPNTNKKTKQYNKKHKKRNDNKDQPNTKTNSI